MVTVMGLRGFKGFKGSDWDCTEFGHSYLCHYHIINLLHYYLVQAYNPPTTFSAPTKPCLNVRVEGEATLPGLTSGVCRSISGRNHACTYVPDADY